MLGKPNFNWQQEERSIFEIVSEEGVMRPKTIFYIVQQLCRVLDGQSHEKSSPVNGHVHPQTILVNANGTVRLSDRSLPLSAREAYIPPEQDQFDEATPSATVYAIGMVMLFMATGHEKKGDMDAFVADNALRTIIARCVAFDPKMRFQNVRELSVAMKRAKGKMKKALFILLFVTCIAAAAALIFWFYQDGNARGESVGRESAYTAGYTSGYEKGYSDAPGIGIDGASFDPEFGNLSGNLAGEDGAIAVRSEEEVFFLHEGTIYRMNPYTESVQPLLNDAEAYGLNYYDGWLYYCTDEKVLRVNPQTMTEEVFCDLRSGLLYIVDGDFYLHDLTGTGYLYRINANAGTLTQMNDMIKYNCLNIVGGRLYYIDTDKGGNIYRCDLDGGNVQLINSNNCESFCIYDGKIYAYAASFERDAINYSASFLISMDLDGGNIESFTNIPAYYPNVSDGGIFYIAGNNRTLEWMSHDGRTRYNILSSRTGIFNIAGRWIFYSNEEDGGALWRVRVDGSGNTKVL